MAIAYKSAGAGASSETSGAAVSPASPAVVDAGDILIIHAYFEGTATAPSTPAGFTLLHGPEVIESTIGRHWIYGKIADGTEDGAANALGTAAVTTMRSGRCYSFSGRVSGSITDLVRGFAATSHATDPQMPTVTTTIAGGLAVACMAQNDNNASTSATGETGGDWTEAVAEYVAALTPGLQLQLQTCTPTANPGTVSGGSVATTNDPCGVIGFEIRPEVPAANQYTLACDAGTFTETGQAASLEVGRKLVAAAASYAWSGVAATLRAARKLIAGAGTYAWTGQSATLTYTPGGYVMPADAGSYAWTGQAASLEYGRELAAGAGGYALAGQAVTFDRTYRLAAAAASYSWNGQSASLVYDTGEEISTSIISSVIGPQIAGGLGRGGVRIGSRR